MSLFRRKKLKIDMVGYENGKQVHLSAYNDKSDSKTIQELSEELKRQDEQLSAILSAERKYEYDKDICALIDFWETIWKNGGVLFNGGKWAFRLPELYIQQKRYDDALRIINLISNPQCKDKKRAYIEKVKSRQQAAK